MFLKWLLLSQVGLVCELHSLVPISAGFSENEGRRTDLCPGIQILGGIYGDAGEDVK
jgi:hypothetical protein